MLVVIALGDSAIVQRDQPLNSHALRQCIQHAAQCIAEIANQHQVILLHGNGPAIGLLTLMNGNCADLNTGTADVLGAQARAMTGFLLEQGLRNQLPQKSFCSMSHLTLVDADDPAMMHPTRYVGPLYNRVQAQLVQEQNPDWVLQRTGRLYRRMIPAPVPKDVLEMATLKHLVAADNIFVICGCGGGLPVRNDTDNRLHGVEAMVDRDETAAFIARKLNANALLMLSSIDAVLDKPGHPEARQIRTITINRLESLGFNDTAMAPKVKAASGYLAKNELAKDDLADRQLNDRRRFCAIGNLHNAASVLSGQSGTRISASASSSSEGAEIVYY
ncbi:carbamate kinase [Endozoicomonas lisbonensis]|uniref:Carbamate kinase n=1 Tax=Endozoicomonas lisbonensis TaxID=3120522 RepID=A0ABV2SEU5_9GAMM